MPVSLRSKVHIFPLHCTVYASRLSWCELEVSIMLKTTSVDHLELLETLLLNSNELKCTFFRDFECHLVSLRSFKGRQLYCRYLQNSAACTKTTWVDEKHCSKRKKKYVFDFFFFFTVEVSINFGLNMEIKSAAYRSHGPCLSTPQRFHHVAHRHSGPCPTRSDICILQHLEP